MSTDLPSSAATVIVGGGIIGASIAYHLTRLGRRDVIVLERHQLTSGTTWHAAGLVMQLRNSLAMTELSRYGAQLYAQLEEETGQSTGFQRCGSLQIARNDERMIEVLRLGSMGRRFDVPVEVLTPADVTRLHPLVDNSHLRGGIFIPDDGTTNPVDTTMALAKGAKAEGARFFEGIEVTGFDIRDGKLEGVQTKQGNIACETVVNCAGIWAGEIGEMAGVRVPLYAAEHMYATTTPIPGLPSNLPVLRDVDGYVYIKEDAGKLLVGAFEPVAKPLPLNRLPGSFAFGELPEDWDHFTLPMEKAMELVPSLETAEIRHFMNGPESFTPDNKFLMGAAPELANYYVAAGFNSQGILSAAGVGRAMAEWITAGAPTLDLAELDIARFHPFQSNEAYLSDRTVESVGLLYAMHWPQRQMTTARPARLSPLHFRLAENNACFGELSGWERANWFAPKGVTPENQYSYGRQNWFEPVGEEHHAVRNQAGLFDLSSFAKIIIEGPDAEAAMQWICSADMSGPVGKVTFTLLLNARGGIEADVTVTRQSEDKFMLVAAAAMQSRLMAWLRSNIDANLRVNVYDATSGFGVLALMGPNARDLLQGLTSADLGNEAFAFGTAQKIEIGYGLVAAQRITYVGELGWELYAPTEFMVPLFDRIVARGKEFGLRLAGYQALDSLRMEKAYRHWGDDITPADMSREAGLGFAVSRRKTMDFIGRTAADAQREKPLKRTLLQFVLNDSAPMLYRDELILHQGKVIGHISSGAYGYTLGASVGLGYVDHPEKGLADMLAAGGFEIEIAGDRFNATAHRRPAHDPDGANIKI